MEDVLVFRVSGDGKGVYTIVFWLPSPGTYNVRLTFRGQEVGRVSPFLLQIGLPYTSIGREGKGDGQFDGPEVVCESENGFIFVCDSRNNRV
jgi:hypothetical protein